MIHFEIKTEHPIATNSPDHLYPSGTKRDNTVHLPFNNRLVKLLGKDFTSVLDLGCSGGGMVKSFLDMGYIAVGVEGSDYSLINKRAAWAEIPDYLFTADITQPFTLREVGKRKPYLFDVVTGWEFFEHIHKDDLPQVAKNIRKHLKPGGLVMLTTTRNHSRRAGIDYHQTQKSGEWWLGFFKGEGFTFRIDYTRFMESSFLRKGEIRMVLQYAG